jgi:hypothetical protein
MSYLNDDKFDDFIDRGIRLMFFLAAIAISIAAVGLNIVIMNYIIKTLFL